MVTALDPKTKARDAGPGSERTFGLVFAGLFVIIGCRPLLSGDGLIGGRSVLAVAFAVAAFAAPGALQPLNWLWHRFGLLLHRIMSPLDHGGDLLPRRHARRADHAAFRQGRARPAPAPRS